MVRLQWNILSCFSGAVLGFMIALMGPSGCASSSRLADRLQSESVSERIKACIEAGEKRDTTVLPLLVERLEDDDADVRFFAILALKKITHKDMGYHYYDDYKNRVQAVQRWRKWLEQNKGNMKRRGG